ncbi:hypothetical protein N7456_007183 [Penicillium angulare]|uniref:DUF7580 domain-containing protein n=1 Tax=Penicillium angulare TaxID=116970 RepID=A0A9W9KCV3_9EURO|nr:hypothetical protein N7456_007183 [Penicillium angulare]
MDSLDQLLGESRTSSRLSSCHIQDQILLFYNLANSMLDLCRGYWIHNPWSSKDVHKHPAILRLGIILLEIATGLKFEESNDQDQVSKLNKDNYKASDIFKDIQEQGRKDPTKRLPSGLSRAISACLDVKPTPSITAAQLTGKQEGPIRQYVLSCIVAPLASDLSSFGVTLERSHDCASHDMNKERLHEASVPTLATDKQEAKSASWSSYKSTNLSNGITFSSDLYVI